MVLAEVTATIYCYILGIGWGDYIRVFACKNCLYLDRFI